MLSTKFIKDIFIYGFSTVLGRVIYYLLVPFHTLILLPEQYGTITEFYGAIAILQVICTFGIETSYFRFHKEHPEYKSIAQTIILAISLAVSLPILLYYAFFTKSIDFYYHHFAIFTALSIVIIDSFSVIPLAHLRLLGKAKLFATIKFFQIILNVFFNVLIVLDQLYLHIVDKKGLVVAILMANALSNFIFIPVMMYYGGGVRLKLSKEWVKKTIYYNLPLVYMSLMFSVNEILSRMSIRFWLPDNFYPGESAQYALGIFSANQKLAIFMTLAMQAYRQAAEPMFFKNMHTKDKSWFDNIMYWFVIAGCAIIVLISFNLEFLAKIFFQRKEYTEALYIVPMLLVSALFSGIYYNVSFWFKKNDENRYSAIFVSLGCIINLAVSAYTIPMLGYWGAAIGSILSYALMSILAFCVVKKSYNVNYSLKTFGTVIIFSVLLVYCINHFWIVKTFSDCIIKGIFSIFVVGLLGIVAKAAPCCPGRIIDTGS